MHTLHRVAVQLLFVKKPFSDVTKLAANFIEKNKELLLRKPLVEHLLQNKQEGEVWIQSSSPEFLVTLIGKMVGADRVLGTSYTLDEKGAVLSIRNVVDGTAKLASLKAYLKERMIDNAVITVYSDNINDLPLLEYATNAIVVCPDKQLRKIAKERMWRIWDVE